MFTTNNGGAPGVNTPIEKTAGAINTNGLHTDTNSVNFRSHGAVNQADDDKAIANQIARLALAGHAVQKGQSGDYLVSKYGMSRYCQDFAELQAFAVKLGVNHE